MLRFFFNNSSITNYNHLPMATRIFDDKVVVYIAIPGYSKDDVTVKYVSKYNAVSVSFNKNVAADLKTKVQGGKIKIISDPILISFNTEYYDASKAQAKLENGLLEITIPELTDDSYDETIISIE